MLVDFRAEQALSWGGDCTLRLWALNTARDLQSDTNRDRLLPSCAVCTGHAEPVGDAEVDWEGRHALSWTLECNGAAILWDLDTGIAQVNSQLELANLQETFFREWIALASVSPGRNAAACYMLEAVLMIGRPLARRTTQNHSRILTHDCLRSPKHSNRVVAS
eukprot:6140976-Amphidinium_carterae.1